MVRQAARTMRQGREHGDGGKTLNHVSSPSVSLERASTNGQTFPIFGAARRPDREWNTHFSPMLDKKFKLFLVVGDENR
jgi:hypothetical protein